MKNKIIVRFVVSCVIVFVAMFIMDKQSVSYHASANNQQNDKTPKVKSGPEVAARVKLLKENNKTIRAALKVFEDKGHKTKIEDSFALTGSYPSKKLAYAADSNDSSRIFQKASFVQQPQIGDDYVELTWVPTLSIEYEWQGTAIATKYDNYGNVIDQYVADIVMVMPDHNTNQWEVMYEVPFYNGIAQEPLYEPGMYTDINLGEPLSQQQLELSQPISKLGKVEFANNVHFVKANAQRRLGGWRAWARCTGAWGVGAAAGCVIAHVWNAEVLWGPCTAAGTVVGAIGCTWGTLWE